MSGCRVCGGVVVVGPLCPKHGHQWRYSGEQIRSDNIVDPSQLATLRRKAAFVDFITRIQAEERNGTKGNHESRSE